MGCDLNRLTDDEKSRLVETVRLWLQEHRTDQAGTFDSNVFLSLYKQLLYEPAHIDWTSWKHLGEEKQQHYDQLPAWDPSVNGRELLGRVAVVRLNGGLGTTMGCRGPKSLIRVKNGLSFLQLALLQLKAHNERYESDVPLILLNSFNTTAETVQALEQYDIHGLRVLNCEQSRCPRIYTDTLLPVDDDLSEGCYPPGHGNVLAAMAQSGLMQRLLDEGRDLLFISNIDNTGATLDMRIAGLMASQQLDYLMEVTKKTEMDMKGGTLIELQNGSIMHLEMPQVPPDHLNDFCSLNVFKIFNTNNIWVNVRSALAKLSTLKMEIIVNHKKLSTGRPVIQLETSIGGAIRNFERVCALHVDRARFLPVKSTEHLLPIMSDAFECDENYGIRRVAPVLAVVKLSSEWSHVDELLRRCPYVPSMRALRSLTIEGDVYLEKDVTLQGDIRLTAATHGQKLVIPAGCTLCDRQLSTV